MRLPSSCEWWAHLWVHPYLKSVFGFPALQVAVKMFSSKISALVYSDRVLFDGVPPHGFLENELSSMIHHSAKNRSALQVLSSQNFALEPATAAIGSYSWASVGVAGMLLILCWHGCIYGVACWNRQARICVCLRWTKIELDGAHETKEKRGSEIDSVKSER